MTKILAIITLYHPESALIENLIKNSLAYSGCDVFLSDNAEFSSEVLNNPRIIYHANHSNLGLGAAQNIGLKFAQEKNYDYVILFDQDSQIENNFIANIIQEFELARQTDIKLIAAGPSFVDPRFDDKRAVKYVRSQNRTQKMVIASGCIISVPELNAVGLMDERLFIYHVDTEWGYRVWSKGYHIMQLSQVVMHHTMGEVRTLWGGYKISYYRPDCYYYFFRNAILVARKPYVPFKDKLKILFIYNNNYLLIFKIPFLDHRWQRFKFMLKGIWDGIK